MTDLQLPSPEPDFQALRARLSQIRVDRGFTLDDLAERSGVGRRTILGITGDGIVGSLETWLRLIYALDVTPDEMFGAAMPPREP